MRLLRGLRLWAEGSDAGQPLAIRAPHHALHIVTAPTCALAASAARGEGAPWFVWGPCAALGAGYALYALAKQSSDRALDMPGVTQAQRDHDAAVDTRLLSLSLALGALALAPGWMAPVLTLAAMAVAVLLARAGAR